MRPAQPPAHRLAIQFAVAAIFVLPVALSAGSMTSTAYSVAADSVDAGGGRTTSALYNNQGCLGGIGGISTVGAPAEVARHGYAGQLYEVVNLAVSANPTNVNEGATRQLGASAVLDDASVLNLGPATVAWSVDSGPVDSINASGLATAGHVYQDTLATVRATALAKAGTLDLLVSNVSNDDFGSYAGDGLNDAWQVQNFGENNPSGLASADPDHDGQNNSYEEMVGSIPTDGNSFFRFRIEPVTGHTDRKNLIFSPRIGGRTYTVEARTDLAAGVYAAVSPVVVSDVGPERTVTDIDAVETNKFYRVVITKP
jgi:hypothetical protein